MIDIVCYAGGTCGDLVSALIDPRGAELRPNGTVLHVPERVRLKKPHLFADDVEKDQYLESVAYDSISSHDSEYHIKRNHPFLSVSVQDFETALWAAGRFKSLHREHVWAEMQSKCGANSVEEYAQMMIDHTNMVAQSGCNIVKLESILQGSVIDDIQSFIGRPVIPSAVEFYKNWMKAQGL